MAGKQKEFHPFLPHRELPRFYQETPLDSYCPYEEKKTSIFADEKAHFLELTVERIGVCFVEDEIKALVKAGVLSGYLLEQRIQDYKLTLYFKSQSY